MRLQLRTDFIEGPDISDWYTILSPPIGATTTAPTKPTTVLYDRFWVRRVGHNMQLNYSYEANSLVGAVAGSGTYLWTVPFGLTIDTTNFQSSGSNALGYSRAGHSFSQGFNVIPGTINRGFGFVHIYDSTRLFLSIEDVQPYFTATPANRSRFRVASSSWFNITGTPTSYNWMAQFPILEWRNP